MAVSVYDVRPDVTSISARRIYSDALLYRSSGRVTTGPTSASGPCPSRLPAINLTSNLSAVNVVTVGQHGLPKPTPVSDCLMISIKNESNVDTNSNSVPIFSFAQL